MNRRLVLSGCISLAFSTLAACSSNSGTKADAGSGGTTSGGTGGAPTSGTTGGGAGATATGGTADGIRDITGIELVKEMKVGWNLGNTLDAPDGEISWGNPLTTQAMLDMVHDAGFQTVRIPVTWYKHLGAAPDYTIEPAWLDRVEEVVGYALKDGMHVILNTHHDEWVSVMPDADEAAIADELSKLWTQISTRFKDYDDHLVFETLNEPRTTDATQWTGGTPAARARLNNYNAAAVKAIRDTGGNNALRFVMIPTHGANASNECVGDLVVPNNDKHIILSLHTYYPWAFCGDAAGTAAFGTPSDLDAMNVELDRIAALTVEKGQAAIIGEWASLDKGNTGAREVHAQAYAAAAKKRGFLTVWWDNDVTGANGMGLLDRHTLSWFYPTIRDALMAGVASAP